MKKFILFLTGIILVSPSFAGDLSIGVIDLLRLNKEASVMKSLNRQKEAEVAKVTKSVEEKRKEFEKREADLKSKQALMDKDAFVKAVQTFQLDMVNTDKATQQKLSAIEQGYINSLQKVQKDYLDRIISKIGKEKKFSLIINGQTAVVIDTKLDVTSEVIDALNEEVKEIKLEVK